MPKLKTFEVTLWETVGGSIKVKAKTKAQALKKAEEILSWHGAENIPTFNVGHRENEIMDATEEEG